MAEIRHLENLEIVKYQRKIIDFDGIWYINADFELGEGHVTKYENFKSLRSHMAAIVKFVFWP